MLRRSGLHFCHELLLLHPPVLEPDGDLPLRQVGGSGDLPPLVLGYEFVGSVFFLQLLQLHLGVGDPLLSAAAERRAVMLMSHHICERADREKRAERQAEEGGTHRDTLLAFKSSKSQTRESCESL